MRFSQGSVLLVVGVSLLGVAQAECPNACSGHGQCGPHDMCTCDRNWQGSDCSLRTCPFGKSHIDTPKGDLDGSLSVGLSNEIVLTDSTVYPYGTTEGFPLMTDTAGNVITNAAHDYAECSNKGLCDRLRGQCECLPGYDGHACQRASCPTDAKTVTPGSGVEGKSNVAFKSFQTGSAFVGNSRVSTIPLKNQCSGHGTCMPIEQLAFLDNNNIYDLWDKDMSMGCKCDAGYYGPDCGDRMCVSGIDPLYTDDTTAQVTQTTIRFESSGNDVIEGEYAIKFYDITGEDWITRAIPISGTDTNHCDAVEHALLELPNGAIPSISCSQTGNAPIDTDRGVEYTLTFTGNPGFLRQLEIDQYLDGSRPSVYVSSGTLESTVHQKVVGESKDYFADRCEGITVKILADSADADDSWNGDVRPGSIGYISGPTTDLTPAEVKKLKKCLSDSDWDYENNVEVANWDTGANEEQHGGGTYSMIGAFPHAMKVVPVESSTGYNIHTAGHYHLVWYDANAAAGKQFRVANLHSDANVHAEATEMYVYTTKGTVQQMAWGSETPIGDNPPQIADTSGGGATSTRIVGFFNKGENRIYTNYDTSCRNNPTTGAKNHVCVNKGDKLFVVDSCWGQGDRGAGTTTPMFGGIDVTNNCATSASPNKSSGNIYTVTKVHTQPMNSLSAVAPSDQIDITAGVDLERYMNTYVIEVSASLGWDAVESDPENSGLAPADNTQWSDNTGNVILFHFTPHKDGSYQYISQCSNRGHCNKDKGECECFDGYTGLDCSIQNVLAKRKVDPNKKAS